MHLTLCPKLPGVCTSRGNCSRCTAPAPCASGSPDLLEDGRDGDAEAGNGRVDCGAFADGETPGEPGCSRSAGGDTWEPMGEGWPWRVAGERQVSSWVLPGQLAPVLQQDGPWPPTASSYWGSPGADFACAPAIRARWGRGGSVRHQCCLNAAFPPISARDIGGGAKSASTCERFIVSLSPL